MTPKAEAVPSSLGLGSRSLAGLFLCCAVLLVSPWRIVDTDALANLATGRYLVEHREIPSSDPFTFSDPDRAWSNPEWLGQILWYGAYQIAGEGGVVALKLTLLVLGWFLVWRWAIGFGAPPLWIASVLVIGFSFCHVRFVARSEVHLYWLLAAYGLILNRSRHRRPLQLYWLLPLAVVWANLHSSFIIGWLFLGSALLGYRWQQDSEAQPGFLRALLIVLLLHPLMALVNPQGLQVYEQLFSHIAGGNLYRGLVIEWRSSLATAPIAFFLHGVTILGLGSFVPRTNRRRIFELCLFALGLLFAYASQRFVPLAVVLCLPVAASNWARAFGAMASTSRLRALSVTLGTAAFVVNAFTVTGVREHPRRPLLEDEGTPLGAASFVGRSAPERSRLFNPYNAGPWLLWRASTRVKLYIDPRNNLGAKALQHYVKDVLPKPGVFFGEATRLGIGLTMVDISDGRMARLHKAMQKHEDWQLGYFDGTYAIYGRRGAKNRQWLTDHHIPGFQAHLGLEYLLALQPTTRDRILARLNVEAPLFGGVVMAYLLLAKDAPPPLLPKRFDRPATDRAETLLLKAMPALPPSAALFSYLATAARRLGHKGLAKSAHLQGLQFFPRAAHTLARRSIWEGIDLREKIPPGHPLRTIIGVPRATGANAQ